jgi:hypothetical protein
MKNMIRGLLLSAAFMGGITAPIAATWTTPAQAQAASCSLLSGSDSWTGMNATGSTYTVSVAYNTGVSITGTPPPFASLPVVLFSSSGHRLAISAVPGGARRYEGNFTSTIPETCGCQNLACNYYGSGCEYLANANCGLTASGCTTTSCGGGGGSCSGGVCTTVTDFAAAF